MSEKTKLTKVAVYGSLLKGFGNSALLSNSELLGTTIIEGFDMYSLGAFPAITPNTEDKPRIQVEVYEVDDLVMQRLDTLEGYPRFYNRMKVEYDLGKGTESAWIYFIENINNYRQNQAPLPRVECGSWREYRVRRAEH